MCYLTLLINTKRLRKQYIDIETEIDVKVCFYELNSSKQTRLNMMELCVATFLLLLSLLKKL